MKRKLSLFIALLLASFWIACSNSHGSGSNPTTPKFLVAIDGCLTTPCSSLANVNVFPINATTGALGTAVSGAPFNMGLADPVVVEVHPNGKWFYVADGSDGSIHQWDVNESTGVPADIATKIINESGSFFEPGDSPPGDSPTHVLTITPNGKYLYSANNDGTVGAYSIGSNGALSHIGDLSVSNCSTGDPAATPPVTGDTGAVTSTDNFVWVTDTCGDPNYSDGTTQGTHGSGGPWYVYTLKIGSNGSLSKTSTATLTGVYSWLWSIQANPVANLLYVGDEGGIAQTYGYSVAADGSLTELNLNALGSPATMQYPDNNSSDCRFIAHSPDGKFFYWTDDDNSVHTFSVDTTSGAVAELAAPESPYQIQGGGVTTPFGGQGQIVVDETGKFVYAAEIYATTSNTGTTGGVLSFTRDSTTGALTLIGTADTGTANSKAVALGIVR